MKSRYSTEMLRLVTHPGRLLVVLMLALMTVTTSAAAVPSTAQPDPGVMLLTVADLPDWELVASSHEEFVSGTTDAWSRDAQVRFRGPMDGAFAKSELQVYAMLKADAARARLDFSRESAMPHLQPEIPLPAGLGNAAVAWHYASSASTIGFAVWILQGRAVLFLDSAGDQQGGPSDALIIGLAVAEARHAGAADLSGPSYDWSGLLPDLPRPWDLVLGATDVSDVWSDARTLNAAMQLPRADLIGSVDMVRADGASLKSWVEAYDTVDAAVKLGDQTMLSPAFPLPPLGDESEGGTSVYDVAGRGMRHYTVSVRRGALVTRVLLDVPADEVGSEQVVLDLARRATAHLDARMAPPGRPVGPNTAREQAWGEYGYQIPAPPELNSALELIHAQGFDWVLTTLSETPTPLAFDSKLGPTAAYDRPHGIRLGPVAAASSAAAQAALIVHEATHVRDELAGHSVASGQSCYTIEMRAVANQVAFWRSLWGPAGTAEPTDSIEAFDNTLLAAYADISVGQALVHTIWAGTCGPG